MNDHAHGDAPTRNVLMRNELKAAVESALAQTPAQFGERLIKEKSVSYTHLTLPTIYSV